MKEEYIHRKCEKHRAVSGRAPKECADCAALKAERDRLNPPPKPKPPKRGPIGYVHKKCEKHRAVSGRAPKECAECARLAGRNGPTTERQSRKPAPSVTKQKRGQEARQARPEARSAESWLRHSEPPRALKTAKAGKRSAPAEKVPERPAQRAERPKERPKTLAEREAELRHEEDAVLHSLRLLEGSLCGVCTHEQSVHKHGKCSECAENRQAHEFATHLTLASRHVAQERLRRAERAPEIPPIIKPIGEWNVLQVGTEEYRFATAGEGYMSAAIKRAVYAGAK